MAARLAGAGGKGMANFYKQKAAWQRAKAAQLMD